MPVHMVQVNFSSREGSIFFLLECIRQQYTLPESRLKNIAHEFVTKDSAEELIDI